MSSQSSTRNSSIAESQVPASAFSKCLVEPDPKSFAQIRTRRRRALGISAFLEISIVAAILVWPLFATGSKLVRRVFIPIPPYGAHHTPSEPAVRRHTSTTLFPVCCIERFPDPHGNSRPSLPGNRFSSAPEIPGTDFGPGSANTNPDGLINVFSTNTAPPPRPEPTPVHTPLASVRRSEGVQTALLIHRVDPRYPALALQTHREGTVQLHAIIARDGAIESLEILSGDPLFLRDALDAVRQWRYRPTLLGGEPVEVETFITVNFRLAH